MYTYSRLMRLTTTVLLFGYGIAKELSLGESCDYLNGLPALEVWKDDCSRQALSSLLPQCLDGLETVTPSQQKVVALELSICELENAKIEYPLDCDKQIRHRNIDKCIQSLEKSPQFWTSYSGNYRNVKEVCHQASLPLKKEQIVEVYANVTNLFQHVLNDLVASQASNEEIQTQIKERFDLMMGIIDQLMKDRKPSADAVNQTFNVFYENLESSLSNALVIIGNSYQGVSTNMNEMEHHLDYFTKELYHISELIRENQVRLDASSKELQNRNDIILNQQNKSLENGKVINDHMLALQNFTKQHFESLDNQFQHTVFQMHSIGAMINQNIESLHVQRQYVDEQSVIILGDISEAFVLYLNSSGQNILTSFETSLSGSLESLEERIEQVVSSIEAFDSRVWTFIHFANNATEYIANLIPNVAHKISAFASTSYDCIASAFFHTRRVLLCMAVVVLSVIAIPFVRFVVKIVRISFVMIAPLALGVVAAILTLQLVMAFVLYVLLTPAFPFPLDNKVYFDMRGDTVYPIDPEIYSNLYTYAHLIDISYCISEVHGIGPPFKCDLNCEKRFPNMTLVYQWYFPDSVTGYVASTYDNIFNYDTSSPKKTVVVSLRGTRSIFDTYADMKVDMTRYANPGMHLSSCGSGCKVHDGFYKYFKTTLNNINDYVINEVGDEDYELVIVGHSLGGSIALLLGLHYLDIGYEKLTLVTMGQPLTGNHDFVNWADGVLGSQSELKHNEFKRKFLRVIHKNDVITTIPRSRNPFIQYHQFGNQIYLNYTTIYKHISHTFERWDFAGS
ncbi:KAR5 [Candida theae]|uniref:triacylglycerol lipase n=1 Tax=Candida theae TaxID=1198502 RepID=A0AAD5BI05_9ASCO|nr:KAR5 [Candida theae]KAI5964550.1 KAR5 [Candida theae]